MTILNTYKKVIDSLFFDFPYGDEYLDGLWYENYHKHTFFSNILTPDSGESLENYAKKTLEYGSKCLFSGEHGWQGNQFLVHKIARDNGLQFRMSVEAYWVKDRHEQDKTNAHIVLIAKNNNGRKAINLALSKANEDGFYFKPRLDLELILGLPVGDVMITSACIAGWNYADAEDVFFKLHRKFGNDFFLEVQYHNTEPQKKLNRRILDMSRKYNINIIFGADSHYVSDEGDEKRNNILEYKHVKYEDEDGWFLDYVNGKTAFSRFKTQGVLSDEEILRAIMNTNYTLTFDDIVFDNKFKIPTVYPHLSYEEKVSEFKKILNAEFKKEKLKSKERVEGIRWEAEQITDSGVVDYFLTNYHIMKNAKGNGGILTTTSRGSAASFYLNKLLGFTTLDRFNSDIPIYPERFLTKDRVLTGSLPDVDYNINSQEPFAQTTRELLGEHGTYPLIAFGTLQVKSAWKMYAGAKQVPFEVANEISKQIEQYEMDLKHASEDDEIEIEDYISDEYMPYFEASSEYRGIVVDKKPHASGWLILNDDIREEIGIIACKSQNSDKVTLVACIDGTMMDYYGFVKNDLLVVDVVELIDKLYKGIGYKEVPTFEELKDMVRDDYLTWGIYAKGLTVCVNQMEKTTTTRNCMKFKPTSMRELSNLTAGIRPGFSSLLDNFINRLPYSVGDEKIDELLSASDHYLLYQENLMNLFNYLGVPMSKCYEIIKKISKKKFKEKEQKEFESQLREKWLENIGNLDNFPKVWQVVQDSARYGFNSPHAYSYAGDSAYVAYFKSHHPYDFYEIACNHYNNKKDKDKVESLLNEAPKMGISIGGYAYGKDNTAFVVDRQESVLYPCLASLKDMNQKFANELWELGQKESYEKLFDCMQSIYNLPTCNKTKFEVLVENDYFQNYTQIPTAKHLSEVYYDYGDKSVLKKDKLDDIPFPEWMIQKHAKETAKQYSCDMQSLMREYFDWYMDKEFTHAVVLDVIQMNPKYNPTLIVYDMQSKSKVTVKVKLEDYIKHGAQKWDTIRITSKNKRQKRKKVGDDWVAIVDEFDIWVSYVHIAQKQL